MCQICYLLKRWPSSRAQTLLLEDPTLVLLVAILSQCMAIHCSWIKSSGPMGTSLPRVHLTAGIGRTCLLPALLLVAPSGFWHHNQRHRTGSHPRVVPILCTEVSVSLVIHWGTSLFMAVHFLAQQASSFVWISTAGSSQIHSNWSVEHQSFFFFHNARKKPKEHKET